MKMKHDLFFCGAETMRSSRVAPRRNVVPMHGLGYLDASAHALDEYVHSLPYAVLLNPFLQVTDRSVLALASTYRSP